MIEEKIREIYAERKYDPMAWPEIESLITMLPEQKQAVWLSWLDRKYFAFRIAELLK